MMKIVVPRFHHDTLEDTGLFCMHLDCFQYICLISWREPENLQKEIMEDFPCFSKIVLVLNKLPFYIYRVTLKFFLLRGCYQILYLLYISDIRTPQWFHSLRVNNTSPLGCSNIFCTTSTTFFFFFVERTLLLLRIIGKKI